MTLDIESDAKHRNTSLSHHANKKIIMKFKNLFYFIYTKIQINHIYTYLFHVKFMEELLVKVNFYCIIM